MHHMPSAPGLPLVKSVAGRAETPLIHLPDLCYRHDVHHLGHFLIVGDHTGVFKTNSLKSFAVFIQCLLERTVGTTSSIHA